MFRTHMNFPEGMEHLFQKLVYTLQINGDSYPRNKIIILKKHKFVRDGEDLTFHQQVTN